MEFNGSAWHPEEGQLEWQNPFGKTYQQARENDLQKKELAESKGYKYIVIHSNDVRVRDKREQKLNILKETINANCEKNQKN